MQDQKIRKLIDDLRYTVKTYDICNAGNTKPATIMRDAADALEDLLDIVEHYKTAYHEEFDARMEVIQRGKANEN